MASEASDISTFDVLYLKLPQLTPGNEAFYVVDRRDDLKPSGRVIVNAKDENDCNAVIHITVGDDGKIAQTISASDIRYVTVCEQPKHAQTGVIAEDWEIVKISTYCNVFSNVIVMVKDLLTAKQMETAIQNFMCASHNGNTSLVKGFSQMVGDYFQTQIKTKQDEPGAVEDTSGDPEEDDQNGEGLYCCLDLEAIAIYKSQWDVIPLQYAFFYVDGPNVVDRIDIFNSTRHVRIHTTQYEFIIKCKNKLPSGKADFISQLKSIPPAINGDIFRDPVKFTEHLTRVLSRMRSDTQPHGVKGTGFGVAPYQSQVRTAVEENARPWLRNRERWEKEINHPYPQTGGASFDAEGDIGGAGFRSIEWNFKLGDEKDAPEHMMMSWIVAETEMKELIANGMVPGSSIESGGLDPFSNTHFRKCIDEIQDALYSQKYDIALSHLRGTRKVFRENPNASVISSEEELDVMKGIFFKIS